MKRETNPDPEWEANEWRKKGLPWEGIADKSFFERGGDSSEHNSYQSSSSLFFTLHAFCDPLSYEL